MLKKHQKFVLFHVLIILCLVCSCSFNIPKDSKVYIVGIGLNYNGVNQLEGTINDTAEFCTYYKYILDKKGIDNEVFYMLQMVDPETNNDITNYKSEYAPSKTNVKNLLNAFADGSSTHQKITKNDLLVIYYSGHGSEASSIEDPERGAMNLMSYPNQTDYDIYPHKELIEDLKKIEGTVVVISDSCFSGHLAGEVSDVSAEINNGSAYNDYGKKGSYSMNFGSLKSVSGIHVLAASQAADYSYENKYSNNNIFNGEKHGLFTGYMLETMGLKHSDTVFGTIPSYVYDTTSNKTHSPPGNTSDVHGTVPSDDKIKRMRLTLNDILQNNKSLTMYNIEQKVVRNNGPCDIILIW
ncbi:MAG: caspase family protein [Sphaerochaetaceae bacterium]|nr:caspase family protein [Sphaerochaetaceae bacterium]